MLFHYLLDWRSTNLRWHKLGTFKDFFSIFYKTHFTVLQSVIELRHHRLCCFTLRFTIHLFLVLNAFPAQRGWEGAVEANIRLVFFFLPVTSKYIIYV